LYVNQNDIIAINDTKESRHNCDISKLKNIEHQIVDNTLYDTLSLFMIVRKIEHRILVKIELRLSY